MKPSKSKNKKSHNSNWCQHYDETYRCNPYRIFPMNNLELTNEQLELLKFVVLNFETNDNEEEETLQEIEGKIYELQEKNALRLVGILKARAKRPEEEW